jgi:hypothetical protein
MKAATMVTQTISLSSRFWRIDLRRSLSRGAEILHRTWLRYKIHIQSGIIRKDGSDIAAVIVRAGCGEHGLYPTARAFWILRKICNRSVPLPDLRRGDDGLTGCSGGDKRSMAFSPISPVLADLRRRLLLVLYAVGA